MVTVRSRYREKTVPYGHKAVRLQDQILFARETVLFPVLDDEFAPALSYDHFLSILPFELTNKLDRECERNTFPSSRTS